MPSLTPEDLVEVAEAVRSVAKLNLDVRKLVVAGHAISLGRVEKPTTTGGVFEYFVTDLVQLHPKRDRAGTGITNLRPALLAVGDEEDDDEEV